LNFETLKLKHWIELKLETWTCNLNMNLDTGPWKLNMNWNELKTWTNIVSHWIKQSWIELNWTLNWNWINIVSHWIKQLWIELNWIFNTELCCVALDESTLNRTELKFVTECTELNLEYELLIWTELNWTELNIYWTNIVSHWIKQYCI
jgi:hypothetical protein